jgi:hypothetical protein
VEAGQLDLCVAAWRGTRVEPRALWLCIAIAADALETGSVLQLKALAFGAVASVHGWERFAVSIQRILVTRLHS